MAIRDRHFTANNTVEVDGNIFEDCVFDDRCQLVFRGKALPRFVRRTINAVEGVSMTAPRSSSICCVRGPEQVRPGAVVLSKPFPP
jgi:hypothetical protein